MRRESPRMAASVPGKRRMPTPTVPPNTIARPKPSPRIRASGAGLSIRSLENLRLRGMLAFRRRADRGNAMSKDESPAPAAPRPAASAWAPFRHRTFAVIWVATVVSNIGGWMYSVASGWLMTSLDADPLFVSLVQVANNLPMFLFALPAGALVDIVDRRVFLIIGETAVTVTSAAFAVLVWLHLITPWSLLVFSFLVTVASAVTA